MRKNSDVFTTTLRLNLKNPLDQEAWDNLMYADSSLPQYSSYTRTIVTAINDHFTRQNHPEDHDSEVIRSQIQTVYLYEIQLYMIIFSCVTKEIDNTGQENI